MRTVYHCVPIERALSKLHSRALIDIPGDGNILDWGCASGVSSHSLKDLYPQATIIGIDVRRDIIFGKRREGIVLLYADGYQMPFRDEFFDAIYCINILSIVANNETVKGLDEKVAEIMKIVKEGGYLIVGDDFNRVIFRRMRGEFSVDDIATEDSMEIPFIPVLTQIISYKDYRQLFFCKEGIGTLREEIIRQIG